MSTQHHRQAILDCPPERVWDLVGDPRRYPDWWPLVVEASGERFDEGFEYTQVTRTSRRGRTESTFTIDRMDELHEVHVSCNDSGHFARWRLTPAQGGTFVDIEIGIDPTGKGIGARVFDWTAATFVYRRWADEAIRALEDAAG
jgi:uncharacterized protein YndB with AHSA1/START domain